jgi:hypothetical protein
VAALAGTDPLNQMPLNHYKIPLNHYKMP